MGLAASTPVITTILTTLTLVAGAALILYVLNLFTLRRSPPQWMITNAMGFAFTVALLATLGSLFYSEIALYEPCKLCWFQRIFMYPQVLLFGIALWKKTEDVWKYAVSFSMVGGLISAFHYYVQKAAFDAAACAVGGVSCTDQYFNRFGFITIPFMCLIAFLLILASAHVRRKCKP